MPDGPLDAALDELYAVDPGEFVAVRKRLSATLRGDGDNDRAKELLAARRPSTSAWAMNQLAREQPQLVDDVLEASSALFAAQTRGSHKLDVLRDAIRAHREAVDTAADAALAVLGGRANDKFRGEIVSTLRAVSTDDDIREQLVLGRIVREASSAGFPDSTSLTLVPSLPAPRTKKEAPKPAPSLPVPIPKAPDPSEALRNQAAAELDAAVVEVDRTHTRVHELEAELETARLDEQTARSKHRKAKSTLRDLR